MSKENARGMRDDVISREQVIDALEKWLHGLFGITEADGTERERSKMQKRKFGELISHFNRKVSDMSIDQKYKMELLGMISAIGFAHEKELSTNLAEVGTDCISREQAIDLLKQMRKDGDMIPWEGKDVFARIRKLPSAQPEIIRCRECKFASGDSRICMKFDHSPIGELDFCSFAERGEVNHESN